MSAGGFTTGLVLAAGESRRLGRPKQLLPYRGRTLLDATLDTARSCDFDRLVVAVGGAAPEIRARVDLRGCTVVENTHFSSGCSSSIAAALDHVGPEAESMVLLLGDQPGVDRRDVAALCATGGEIGVCHYTDGIGHPFRFARAVFPALSGLHGDKGVWKLIESGRYDVAETPIDRPTPLDVDTDDDYRALLESTR